MGVERIAKFIRSCSENYTKDCYVLKLDIQGYFMAINKQILYEKIKKAVHHFEHAEEYHRCRQSALFSFSPASSQQAHSVDWLMKLICQIIFNDPTLNGIFKGRSSEYQGLPITKSLFHTPPHCGLPI